MCTKDPKVLVEQIKQNYSRGCAFPMNQATTKMASSESESKMLFFASSMTNLLNITVGKI